jgi:transcriptional regulator with XRE-family HTH domain
LPLGVEKMSVHEKIKLVRQSKGLTQEEVAEKLNMSVSGYGDIERGDSDLKLSKLEKIADLFGLSINDLFNLNDKSVLNLAYKQNQSNWHISSNSLDYLQVKTELEKQLLIIELKDKELTMKDREITYLKKMLEMTEKLNGENNASHSNHQ